MLSWCSRDVTARAKAAPFAPSPNDSARGPSGSPRCPAPSDREKTQLYIEKFIVDGGIILIKLWLEVSNDEQKRRFEARVKDPLRQWKLSPMDLPSRQRWYDYSRARDLMLSKTDKRGASWHIVRSDDKKTARLNTMAHLLSAIPYKKLPADKVKLPNRSTKGAYDDNASLKGRRFVRERY